MDLVGRPRADTTHQQARQGLEESGGGVQGPQSESDKEPFLREDQQDEQAEGFGEKRLNEVSLASSQYDYSNRITFIYYTKDNHINTKDDFNLTLISN